MSEELESRPRRGICERIGAYLHPEPNYDIDQASDDELHYVSRKSIRKFVSWTGGGAIGVTAGAITFFDGLDIQDRSPGQMAIGVGVMGITGVVSVVRIARNMAAEFDASIELNRRHDAKMDQEAETARVLALERQLAPLVMATEVNPALVASE